MAHATCASAVVVHRTTSDPGSVQFPETSLDGSGGYPLPLCVKSEKKGAGRLFRGHSNSMIVAVARVDTAVDGLGQSLESPGTVTRLGEDTPTSCSLCIIPWPPILWSERMDKSEMFHPFLSFPKSFPI